MAATGTASKEVLLVLDATARVTGRVVMGDKPVTGARVFVPRPNAIASAFTQDDGTFVLDRVPMGPAVPLASVPT